MQLLIASEARFATLEPTLDFLTQLDQLVHLLDSPVRRTQDMRMAVLTGEPGNKQPVKQRI